MKIILIALHLIILFANFANSHEIHMKDGRVIETTSVTERGNTVYYLRHGDARILNKNDIEKIVKTDTKSYDEVRVYFHNKDSIFCERVDIINDKVKCINKRKSITYDKKNVTKILSAEPNGEIAKLKRKKQKQSAKCEEIKSSDTNSVYAKLYSIGAANRRRDACNKKVNAIDRQISALQRISSGQSTYKDGQTNEKRGSTLKKKENQRLGQWGYAVEQLAKADGCQTNGGSDLISKDGPKEIYQVFCKNKEPVIFKCDYGTCSTIN